MVGLKNEDFAGKVWVVSSSFLNGVQEGRRNNRIIEQKKKVQLD
jgi:hypothetical protein